MNLSADSGGLSALCGWAACTGRLGSSCFSGLFSLFFGTARFGTLRFALGFAALAGFFSTTGLFSLLAAFAGLFRTASLGSVLVRFVSSPARSAVTEGTGSCEKGSNKSE